MGSFYATCSITRHTISDGDKMYMQFMLPASYLKDSSIGVMFMESFLNVVKSKGLDEAIKSFDDATASWDKDNELSPKGMIVSDDSSYDKWVPFGPAIRGTYDDYGNIAPLDDEDSQNRVKILEGLMGGLPFATIMDVAQDDRWLTLGLGKYGDTEDKTWKPEGISKDMPEWLLKLCKALSLTYFHASVYDELSKFDFSVEERDGVIKSKYYIKWKNEYLDPIKEKFPIILENLRTPEKEGEDKLASMERRWGNREVLERIGVFRCVNRQLGLIYQSCIARENPPLDWFYESLIFMYSLSGMCVTLDQSQYGSQHLNWFGWQRVYKALNPVLEEALGDRGYYDEEDEDA
jgi:hypothetical protein